MTAWLANVGTWLGVHKPQILIGTGLTMGVGATIWACVATTKAGEVLDRHNAEMEKIEQAKEIAEPGEYTEQDIKSDRLKVWGVTLKDFGKLYGGPAALTAGGIGCVLWGTKILSNRLGVATAALALTEGLFSSYRGRVIEDIGEEKDMEYLTGNKIERRMVEKEVEDPKTGKVKKEKVEESFIDINVANDAFWIKVFGEYNANGSKNNEWDHNIDLCVSSLRAKQNTLNEYFHRNKRKIYLNEVLKEFGFINNDGATKPFDDTPGQIYGWTWAPDKYIDIGIGDYGDPQIRKYINGETDCIVLTFNIDGIYNEDGVLMAPTPIIG